jgi:hypothetical protein
MKGLIHHRSPHILRRFWVGRSITIVSRAIKWFSPYADLSSFAENVNRITALDYIPTETDILQSHKRVCGASDHRFVIDGLITNVIDVGTQRCEMRKWFHQFYDVAAVLFMVNLLCYDEYVSGDNMMMERIELFNNAINIGYFAETTIILFLSNVSNFRDKTSPRPAGNPLYMLHWWQRCWTSWRLSDQPLSEGRLPSTKAVLVSFSWPLRHIEHSVSSCCYPR